MTVYFSNRQENLFEHLKTNLFSSPSSPFAKRIVMVPSQAVGRWLQQRLANHCGCVAGVEICSLSEGVERLSNLRLPTSWALTLQIAQILTEHLPSFPEVLPYLHNREKRLLPLSHHLATLFGKYLLYGLPFREKGEWQERLWHLLFPQDPLGKRTFSFKPHTTCHLFLFGHLSPFHFSFFEALSPSLPVSFYHLSPCQYFWSEMRKDDEEDHPPLLASLGRVGRGFARQVEESSLQTVEDYVEPEETESAFESALGCLQRELLHCEKGEKKEDDSIQVHIHATRHREIEGLYHALVLLAGEKKITPSEVLVMAPDITPYIPSIRALFGKEIAYQIDDFSYPERESLTAGFLLLLDLEKRRWSAPALSALFHHPLFRKKQQWSDEDLSLIDAWVGSCGVRWGFDLFHVERLLGTPFEDGRATWEGGIASLLDQVAEGGIPFTETLLLGEWITVVRELYRDLKPFSGREKRGFQEWSSLMTTLLERYFGGEEERELEGVFALLKEGMLLHPEAAYSFDSLAPFLLKGAKNKSKILNAHHLESVRFSSFLPMRPLPAKMVVLLGMEQDAFPRRERMPALDLLRKTKNPDYSTRGDFDRSLFLETLLSARERLFISYVGKEEGQETPLLSYLSEYVGEKNRVRHPDFAFDKKYFNHSHPLLKNPSSRDYAIAARPRPRKAPPPFFVPQHFTSLPLLEEKSYLLDIREVISALRTPLKGVFEKKLGLFLKQKREEPREEEAFSLSSLDHARFRKASLHTSLEALMAKVQKGKNVPLKHFNDVASQKIKMEWGRVGEGLKEAGLARGEFETLSFSPHITHPRHDHKGTFLLPPVRFSIGQAEIALVGKVEGVTREGLFVYEECTFEKALRSFPLLLLLNLFDGDKKTLFFGKEREKRECSFGVQAHLNALICYTLALREHPSFLFPSWILPILEKDEAALKEAMGQKHFDEEWKVTFSEGARLPEAADVIAEWSALAEILFREVKDAWF